MPIRVFVQDGKVGLAEAVPGIGRMLDNGRFVVSVIQSGSGEMFLETLAPLAACFTNVGGICFAGLIVFPCAGRKVYDAGLIDLFELVFGFDKVFA